MKESDSDLKDQALSWVVANIASNIHNPSFDWFVVVGEDNIKAVEPMFDSEEFIRVYVTKEKR